ncbi:hypothetical protein ACFOEE_05570 [Pseudoalteromonas fenneropenaei]|uniref:Uncharacterized protein n=1 Tax=Pseudoalteromonas fenneropenaei TaxID=1737459 RepID=A0ABV7CH41_9GAMM
MSTLSAKNMLITVGSMLLVDTNSEFTREFAEYYASISDTPCKLVVAGDNTRLLVKLMFQQRIQDYCYCDLSNEISVSELASYLHDHHHIDGVLISALDYHLADDSQRFIFNSLHPVRYLVVQDIDGNYHFERLLDSGFDNHLSCQGRVAEATDDIAETLCKLDSE